jgi:predicted ATPase/DNA-binding SARP family transcriptional activator
MATCILFLFGVPRLERDGAVVNIPRRKARALLAYLAATGKAHARDSLAALFWPDYGQSEARLALSRHLSELNKILPAGALALDGERVALGGDLWVDVSKFAAIAGAASSPAPADLSTLQAAVNLYVADFLAGFTLSDCPDFDDWQAFQTESLRQGLRAVLKLLAWTHAAADDQVSAIAVARRWLALDPLDESAHRALMQLYALSGQQAAALRQYERCVDILNEELGIAPDETTQRLYETIRQGEFRTTRQSQSEDAVASSPLVPLQAPALRHNLPAQTTPFVGRQQEVAELVRLLADPGTRLVTILAPGGMGKTRLGLAVAERQLSHFDDGVFFVPLAPLASPDDIVTAIAEQVGFSFSGNAPPRAQLLDYFRERQMLLVLDNFEHLLAGARLVTDLLQAAPAVKVLATSREKLNLSGETVYVLAGLHFPTWEALEDLLAYDAVRLFIQSVRLTRPDLMLEVEAIGDVAHICRLTEGMPLAIVLAAAWLDVLSLEQIAAELQKGIDILETEQRDVPERQRSVRATFNYSWERLTEEERQVFMRLAVFRGGFAFEAAEIVAGADMRTLRRLANQSLVQALPTDRYEVHELLRQYGEEKLRRTDEADAVHQAHSRYYLGFLAERDEDIKGRRQQAGLREIRSDFENVRQAWLWAAQHQQVDAISRAALDCLTNFADMNFSAMEAHALLSQTISAFQPTAGQPPHPLWDQAVVRQQKVNYILIEPTDHAQIRVILERARARGDTHEMVHCLIALYNHAFGMRDYASPVNDEALALSQVLGDPFYIARAFNNNAFSRLNDLEHRRECLRQSAQIRREIGDRCNLCFSLTQLTACLAEAGAFGEAEQVLEEAIRVQHEIGKTPIYIAVIVVKAQLAFWRGELDLAAELLRTGQAFAGGRVYTGFSYHYPALLSWVASVRGDYEQGYAFAQQLADKPWAKTFFMTWRLGWGLALAHYGLGNAAAARQSLHNVLDLTHHTLKAPSVQQFCLPLAAVLAETPERAAELLGLADRAPQELTGWMAHWQLLTERRRDLEAALGAEQFAAAWERGARLELNDVVDKLLAELQGTQPPEC